MRCSVRTLGHKWPEHERTCAENGRGTGDGGTAQEHSFLDEYNGSGEEALRTKADKYRHGCVEEARTRRWWEATGK
jgi:hypothetical protein